ncbi:MAG TPA: hypothetical protein VHC49_04680, partial [Mycobacteriales bacterium]|nr:hypothetical protein [Mycobacteriales bacterium]
SRSYSMQGYSATVDSHYADTTGTHKASGEGHNTVSLQAVADGRLDQLAAKYLFVQPRYLMSRSNGNVAPRKSDAPRSVGHAPVTWNFGELLRLQHISASVPDGTKGLQLGLVAPDGTTRWFRPKIDGGTVRADFGRPVAAVALRARIGSGSISMGWPKIGLVDGRSFAVNGGLQGALSVRQWAFRGNVDGYAVFENPTAGPPLSVRSKDSSATVRRLAGDPLLPEAAAVSSKSGATVLRSVAAISGWKATWQPDGSSDRRSLPVHRDGLIQAVDVPAGSGTLRWSYQPVGWHAGLAATAAGLVLLLGYGGWAGLSALRRR